MSKVWLPRCWRRGETLREFENTASIMSELISTPLFLIIAAILAIFIVLGILKHAWRFLIWIVVIVAVLVLLGVTNVAELEDWFEKLVK